MRNKLVLRVRRAPDAELLAQLNEDFADILKSGTIEVGEALPEEAGEVAHYSRVTLNFNRRDFGQLRKLIGRLNELVGEDRSPPIEAAPHEIVEAELPPEAEVAEEDED